MHREEAQNILQLCRPDNSEDRNDPLIAEALELLKKDAELRTWFDEQQALDAKIRNDLNRIEPPADLYAAILTGMHAHAAQSQLIGTKAEDTEQDQHTIRFTQPTNRSDQRSGLRAWMGIAAIFAIAGVALMLSRSEAPTQLANNDQSAAGASPIIATAGVPNMIEFLAQQISEFNGSKFDKRGEQVGDLQSHLASTGMPNPAQIPKKLEQLTTIGCVTFDYDGTKLSMICFKNDQVYHLITVDKARVPIDCTPCQGQKSKVFEAQQQAFKVWAEGEQIFILTTQGCKESLADFI
jgi:hypothetical protein|tara:strand:- start:3845 stop:4729 length:885 start_codon:yes stop_codon:yes gene_type:complete